MCHCSHVTAVNYRQHPYTLHFLYFCTREDPGESRFSAALCMLKDAPKKYGPSDETEKTEAPCHSKFGTIKSKIPSCPK